MAKYILKRILWLIPVLLCVATLIFLLMHTIDGDPARMLLGIDATEEQYLAKRAELGLDEPLLMQLGTFLSNTFFRFDFGTSYMTKRSITEEIGPRMLRTLSLGLLGIPIAIVFGILLGVSAATHMGKWQDRLCMLLAIIGVSMPSFWMALMMVLVFAVQLRWFPASGVGTFKHLVLPSLAIGLHGMANFARQTRSGMLDVIRSDYVTTARSKGLSQREVIYKHALPNALIPVITVIGTFLGNMLSGSIVNETIFSIPGMGVYLVTAINNRDYPVVQSCVVLLSIVFCLVMLLVDLAYAAVDPRIKARFASGGKGRKKK